MAPCFISDPDSSAQKQTSTFLVFRMRDTESIFSKILMTSYQKTVILDLEVF